MKADGIAEIWALGLQHSPELRTLQHLRVQFRRRLEEPGAPPQAQADSRDVPGVLLERMISDAQCMMQASAQLGFPGLELQRFALRQGD